MLIMENSVQAAYPGAKMGLLQVTGIRAQSTGGEAEATGALEALRRRHAGLNRAQLKALHPADAYIAYFRLFGQGYPVLSQLESVLAGKKELPAAQPLRAAMFLTELESMLLMAGHDAASLRFPLRLAIAEGTESYRSISGKETAAVPGDMLLCDAQGPISSILRGPDERTRLTDTTTEALFTIYAPPGVTTEEIHCALMALEGRIRRFSPDAETVLRKVYESPFCHG